VAGITSLGGVHEESKINPNPRLKSSQLVSQTLQSKKKCLIPKPWFGTPSLVFDKKRKEGREKGIRKGRKGSRKGRGAEKQKRKAENRNKRIPRSITPFI
jgi:hypothetical protein